MHTSNTDVQGLKKSATHFLQSKNVSRDISITSLELVDFINSQREEREAILDHADLMKKVVKVLKKDAGRFSDIYLDSMNRRQKCYRFLKREACLMAMSYSYELQALVFDRMTALEEQSYQPAALPSYAEALRLYADQIEQTAVLRVENHQQAEKIASLESIFQVGMTPTQFCKRLNGVNCQQVNNALLARKWIFNSERDENRSVKFRVGSIARDKYLTEKVTTISNEGMDAFSKYTPILLREGAKRLHDLYMAQKLPMKKTWDGQFCHCKATVEDLA
ncbi:Rha family transcriptional regulator [Pseudomonas gregormendelii]